MVDITRAVILGPAVAGRAAAQAAIQEQIEAQRGRKARGSVVFVGAGGRTTAQQRAFIERKRQLDRARTILKTAETRLLKPTERAELERITAPPTAPTRADISDLLIRGTGLSPLQRAQLAQQRSLESERVNIIREQTNLDLQRQELEKRFTILQRLSNARVLEFGVAAKFNADVRQFENQQKSLRDKAAITSLKIKSFKKPEVTRVGRVGRPEPIGIPKTAQELFQTGLARELEKEKRIKEVIQRPFGLIDVKETILETERAGREFGAAFIGPTPTPFGARTGAVAGRILGGIEAAAKFGVDRPLFELEKFLGKPVVFEVPRESIIGRTISGVQRVPILPDVLGISKFKPVTRLALEVRRPALREFGTSLALFVGPQVAVKGLRAAARARVPVQTFLAEGFRAPKLRPTFKFIAPEAKIKVPTQAEIEISRILKRRSKTLREIREQFAGVQKKATQEEITRLLGKQPKKKLIIEPARLTPEAIKFGKIELPKPRPLKPKKPVDKLIIEKPTKPETTFIFKRKGVKREIKISFEKLGEKGELFPRRRPTQVQIFKPKRIEDFFTPIKLRVSPPRVVRVVKLKDVLKQFKVPKETLKTPDIFGVRTAGLTLARAGILEAEEQAITPFGRDRTREFTQEFERARQRQFEIEAQRLFGETITRPRARETQRTREAQRTRLRLRTISLTTTRPFQVTPPRDITRPKQPRPPKRPPFVPLFLPKIEVPLEVLPERKKVQGFFAFVKARPFKKRKFVKVSKALSKEAAIQRSLRVSDLTIAQSSKIVKSKKKVRRTFPTQDLRFKFRKKGKTFIEKRKFAIDTVTEKQDLSVAKFLAQEKRRGLSFFGVQPRRRKKRSRRRKR